MMKNIKILSEFFCVVKFHLMLEKDLLDNWDRNKTSSKDFYHLQMNQN